MKAMKSSPSGGGTPPTPASTVPLPKSKRGLKGFFQETAAELKKVHWPTRRETTRLTGVVLTVCVGSVVILWGLSTAFEAILNIILRGG